MTDCLTLPWFTRQKSLSSASRFTVKHSFDFKFSRRTWFNLRKYSCIILLRKHQHLKIHRKEAWPTEMAWSVLLTTKHTTQYIRVSWFPILLTARILMKYLVLACSTPLTRHSQSADQAHSNKFIPWIINRPRAIGFHQNTFFNGRNHVHHRTITIL